MKRWLVVIGALGLVGLAAFAGIAWLASPLAGNFWPPDGAVDVHVRSAIKISFNVPMQHETVEKRLTSDPARMGSFSWEGNTLTFTPDLPWPGGTRIQVQLEAGSRAESGLGLPVWTSQVWSFTTAQALLAYLWPSDSPADLYLLDPLSGEVMRLTQGANALDYSLSPDGLAMYYSAGNTYSGADIYRLDVPKAALSEDELAPPDLVLACERAACRSPQASPDGRWLAYEWVEPGGEGEAQVWLLDLTTNLPTRIGEAGHLTESPSWSSQGMLAFYDQQRAAYIFVDLEQDRRFEAPNTTGQSGSWAPDGSAFLAPEIIMVQGGDVPDLGSSHLIRYTPFGPAADLTVTDLLEDTSPAYSPDGSTIAFARKYLEEPRWSFGRQLWLMNADGSQQRQVTLDDVYNHYDFAWSWDGRWLAYVRFNNATYADPPELWLREADGSNPIQLNYGGYDPQWIP